MEKLGVILSNRTARARRCGACASLLFHPSLHLSVSSSHLFPCGDDWERRRPSPATNTHQVCPDPSLPFLLCETEHPKP